MEWLRGTSLQVRLTLPIGLTMAGIIAVSVYLGVSAVDSAEETAQREKLTLTAGAMTGHVDDVLLRTMGREEHLARMVSNAWAHGDQALTNLLDTYPRFLFESDLYVVRSQGELVWRMRPGISMPAGGFAEPTVAASLDTLESTAGPCSSAAAHDESLACFASPVLLRDGDAAGALLAQIDLTRPDLNLLSLGRLDDSFRVELLTADGLVMAANHPDAGLTSAHAEVLMTLASLGQISDDDAGGPILGTDRDHRFAYAPISTIPGWGVIIEPEEGTTLAVAGRSQQRLWLFALAALPASFAIIWIGTRRLLKPLNALVTRAAQLEDGDLATPVAVARRDEVGALAQVLDRLRMTLKVALADAQHADSAKDENASRRRLLEGLLTRQEEERQRIAHELHEGTLQSLTALALGLDSLKDELASAKEISRDRLTRSRTMALAMIQDLRRLAIELRPPALSDLGLAPALQSYAESRLSDKGVQIHFNASGMETRPSPPIETSLYRVAQEAIDNIATHAQAETVEITLISDGQAVTLVVEDDGMGFEPAEVFADPDAVRGLGILSMQERSALVGGAFSVESAPEQGTRVRAEIPLEEEGVD